MRPYGQVLAMTLLKTAVDTTLAVKGVDIVKVKLPLGEGPGEIFGWSGAQIVKTVEFELGG